MTNSRRVALSFPGFLQLFFVLQLDQFRIDLLLRVTYVDGNSFVASVDLPFYLYAYEHVFDGISKGLAFIQIILVCNAFFFQHFVHEPLVLANSVDLCCNYFFKIYVIV